MNKAYQFSKILYCKETGLVEKFFIDYDREGSRVKKEKNLLNTILPFHKQEKIVSAMVNTREIVENAEDVANYLYEQMVGYGYHQYKVCEKRTDALHYRNEILDNSRLIQFEQVLAPRKLQVRLNQEFDEKIQ